jgi:hypothetical protein
VSSVEGLPGGRQEEEGGPGLREVVERLTSPARAGFVLTKQRLATSAAQLNLPVGFGERSQMLTNLFRAAAELDRLLPLIEALRAEAGRWDSLYLEWATSYPGSAPIWRSWRERLAATRALLDDMAQAVSSVVTAETPRPDEPLPGPVDRQEEYAD